MKYRNVKTGTVIEVSSKLGGNWERLDDVQAVKPAIVVPDVEPEEVKPVKKTRKTTTKKTTKK